MAESMLVLLAGVAILWAIWSDRGNIPANWKSPANAWKGDNGSRDPSQPLMVVLGVPLGLGAVAYGLWTLVS